jgi:hypothetical protein
LERLGLVVHGLPVAYESFRLAKQRGGGQRQKPVFTSIVVNNFRFQIAVVDDEHAVAETMWGGDIHMTPEVRGHVP